MSDYNQTSYQPESYEELQAKNSQLKADILKYGNNPAGFDWAVLEEIEKLKAENEEIRNSWHIDLNDKVALTADLEAAKKKIAAYEDNIDAYANKIVRLEKLKADLEAVREEHRQVLYENNKNFQKLLADKDRQASFTPAFVSSAQNDELAKVKAELAEAKKQIDLMHDNGLGESWIEHAEAARLKAELEAKNKYSAGIHARLIASDNEAERLKKQLAEARELILHCVDTPVDCEDNKHVMACRVMDLAHKVKTEQALKARE